MTQHNIIFFDGECNFCNSSVHFIIDRDPQKKFRFAKLKGQVANDIIPHNKLIEIDKSLILFKEGQIFYRAEAVLLIVKELAGGWRFLYYLAKVFPNIILNACYNFISKHRHKLIKSNACKIYSEHEKDRFLD